MFQLIVLAWVIYILYRWLRSGASPAPKPRSVEPPGEQAVEEMVQDPVCGTWVPLGQAVPLDVKREKHYFCSPECRDKFLAGRGQAR
jgi:YHS domain-containing protein